MDPAAIERARAKAEAVRASLQQKQQSIVDRRRQQDQKSEPSAAPAAAPAAAPDNSSATKVPPTDPIAPTNSIREKLLQVQRESAEASIAEGRRSGLPNQPIPPPPPVMEDFTASANEGNDSSDDDDDDTGSTFHDDRESSTTQGTGAAVSAAATATTPNEAPHTKEVRFSLSTESPTKEEPMPMSRSTESASSARATPPLKPIQQEQQARAGGSLLSASVTRQVLSTPDSDDQASAQPREPRYLRYRDSLRTSLQKSSITNSATVAASAARDSLASSDDTTPIKNQLLSYFDKSLPPTGGSTSGTADDEPM